MNRPLKTALILTAILCCALPSHALKRSELLPQEILFEVRVSNTLSFLDKLKKSSLGRLWMDQQFQDFVGNPDQDVWEELLFEGERTAEDEIIIEQFKMIKGEVIFAVSEEDDDDVYVIADMSEEDFLRSLVLDDKMKDLSEEPFDIVKSTFQDIEIIQHISNPGTETASHSWQAHLNRTLVMGPSREWVERSIVRLKEESIVEPEGNPVLNFRLPLSRIIRRSVEEANDGSGASTTALFEALGLMGIEEFTLRLELKDDELVVDNELAAADLTRGIFTILNLEPAEIPAVGFVPENISLLEVGRMNLLRFWQEIPVVLMAAMPEAKPQFDMVMGMIRQQTGIDIELDLLNHLGTRYLGFSFFDNEILINVMAVELSDGPAFKRGLEAILNAPVVQPQFTTSFDVVDFLDHTLYVSKYDDPADAVAFAVSGEYLLYGQPDGVRQVIRSESSEAAANPQFEQSKLVQGLRLHTPDKAFGFSAVDWKKNMDFVIRELSDPQLAQMILGEWATSGAPIPPPDLNKLPPADHLASFFNTSYMYLEKTDRGLHQKIILRY
jgi:hypothetical protein